MTAKSFLSLRKMPDSLTSISDRLVKGDIKTLQNIVQASGNKILKSKINFEEESIDGIKMDPEDFILYISQFVAGVLSGVTIDQSYELFKTRLNFFIENRGRCIGIQEVLDSFEVTKSSLKSIVTKHFIPDLKVYNKRTQNNYVLYKIKGGDYIFGIQEEIDIKLEEIRAENTSEPKLLNFQSKMDFFKSHIGEDISHDDIAKAFNYPISNVPQRISDMRKILEEKELLYEIKSYKNGFYRCSEITIFNIKNNQAKNSINKSNKTILGIDFSDEEFSILESALNGGYEFNSEDMIFFKIKDQINSKLCNRGQIIKWNGKFVFDPTKDYIGTKKVKEFVLSKGRKMKRFMESRKGELVHKDEILAYLGIVDNTFNNIPRKAKDLIIDYGCTIISVEGKEGYYLYDNFLEKNDI